MNEKNGKLLILGGCGVSILQAVLVLLFGLLKRPAPGLINWIGIISMPLLAVGFLMIFLDKQNIIDAAIAGCFGVCALVQFINIPILATLSGLIALAGYAMWAFKLFGDNRTAGLALIGSFVLSFVGILLGIVFAAATGGMNTYGLVVFISLVSLASDALCAFAAYMDYNG